MSRYGYHHRHYREIDAKSLAAQLSAVMTGFALLSSIIARDPWLSARLAEGVGLASFLGIASAILALAATIIAGPRAAIANLLFIMAVGVAVSLGQGLLGGIINGYYAVYSSMLSSLRFLGIPFYLALLYAGLTPVLAITPAIVKPRKRRIAKRSTALPAHKTPQPSASPKPLRTSIEPVGPGAPPTQPRLTADTTQLTKPSSVPGRLEARQCPRLSEWGRIISSSEGPQIIASCWLGREVYSYLIEEFIGAGGFGLVLKARSKYNIRDVVAIKIIYPVPVSGGGDKVVTSKKITEIAEEIHRESASLQEVSRKSPFIVRLHAIHLDTHVLRQAILRDDPRIYIENPMAIIMEYMGGGSLSKLLDTVISEYGSSKLRTDANWLKASSALVYVTAEALYTVHKSGFMHGDVKPQNILFTRKPPTSPSELSFKLVNSIKSAQEGSKADVLPKLSDLGSAVRLSEPVASFTPLYAPPELLEYDAKCSSPGARYKAECAEQPRASPQIDVYSLGLIALQLFAALRNKDLTAWRRSGQLDTREGIESALTSLGVPLRVSTFIASMLDPNPKSRPTTKEIVEFFRDYTRL